MEQDAWIISEDEEDAKKAYQYFMRVDPEMREFGELEERFDPFLQRQVTIRHTKLGMTRNAKEENMHEVEVYLKVDGKPVIPHIRQDSAKPLQGWYQSAQVSDHPSARPRPCFTDAILTQPYGGYCTVGCAFCYVNSGFRGYRGSGIVTVPLNYGNQIAKQMSSMRTLAAGYFSSFTDPFLPLEHIYHNTEAAASVFVNSGVPIFFLSRLHYPDWAFDLLKKSPYSYAQKSLNTGDPDDWKKLSPAAISLEDHITEVGELRKAGIYTSIQVNPIIAGITTHEDIRNLFEMLAAVNNNHVIVKFVEAGYSWAPTMVERIEKRFGGNRSAYFRDLFSENTAGAQKTIKEEYRLEAHRLYQSWATELGMTYATCYEYRAGKDGEPRWVSIGPEFTTADQCHGHRVPMFTRITTSEPWNEVKECPPTGCLLCASGNEGKPRCGNTEMGAAKALRMPDLRQPVKTRRRLHAH